MCHMTQAPALARRNCAGVHGSLIQAASAVRVGLFRNCLFWSSVGQMWFKFITHMWANFFQIWRSSGAGKSIVEQLGVSNDRF